MGPGEDDDDDLPATQPVSSMIMQGVVAYVEVRSGHDNRTRGVQAQLRNLGATIAQTLTKEVTHVIFNEGLPSTYKKAKRLKCHLVSVLWIEACKDALGIVSEAGYPPIGQQIYEDPNSLKNFKKFKSMQPDFEEKQGEERIGKILNRIKRRKPAENTSCPKTRRQRFLQTSCAEDLSSSSSPARQLPQIKEHRFTQPEAKSKNKRTAKVKTKTALKHQEVHVSSELIPSDHEESFKKSSVQGVGSRNTQHVNNNVVITISDDSDNMELGTIPSTSASVPSNQAPTFSTEYNADRHSQCKKYSNYTKTVTTGLVGHLAPKTYVRQRKKGTPSPMSRNEFVNRLSELVLHFKEEQTVRPSWLPPKQKTAGFLPTDSTLHSADISPQKSGRNSEKKEEQTTKIRSKVNPVSTMQERMPYVSASAALMKHKKAPFPLPSSPKDDFMLLSQEPNDVSLNLMEDREGKGAKRCLKLGEEKVNYSEIVRAYDAYAKKIAKGAEQIQSSEGPAVCEIQDSDEEQNEGSMQSTQETGTTSPQAHSQQPILLSSEGSSPDALKMIDDSESNPVDDLETKTEFLHFAAVHSLSGGDSSVAANIISTPRLFSELSGSASTSSDVGNAALSSNPSLQEKLPVETQCYSNAIDSSESRGALIHEIEERSPSPVFVISRPKFRRRLNTNACTSVKQEYIPNVKEDFENRVDKISDSSNNCTQYLNKTLQTLQPKLRILNSSEASEKPLGEVLVQDTPEFVYLSQKRRLQDEAKTIIPPTPEEKLASSHLTNEQNQSVTTISLPCKSLKKPLFSSRTQKTMLSSIAEDSTPSSTRREKDNSSCVVLNFIKPDTEEDNNENSIKNEKSDHPLRNESLHFDKANKIRSPVRRSPRISTIHSVKQENCAESDSSVSVAAEHPRHAQKRKLQCKTEDDSKPEQMVTSSQGSVQSSNPSSTIKRRSRRSCVKRSDDEESKLCLNECQGSKTIVECSFPTSFVSNNIKQIGIKVEDTSGYETLEEEKNHPPTVSHKRRNRKSSGESASGPSPKRKRSDKSRCENAVEDLPQSSNIKKKSDAYNESVPVIESNTAKQGRNTSLEGLKTSLRRVKHEQEVTNIHVKVKEEFTKQNKRLPLRIKQEDPVRCSPRRHLSLSCPEQQNASFDTSISTSSLRSLKQCARRHTEKLKPPQVRMTRSFSKETTPSIVCTFLNASEQKVVENAVKSLGHMQVEEKVTAQTTHVVATGPKRTMNMLKGLVRGCWLLQLNWVLESVKKGRWLSEEPFEMTEFSPAVKECRRRRQLAGPEYQHRLFATSGPIFLSPQTKGPPVKELHELLELCGAELVTSRQKANIVIGINVSKKKNVRCVDPVWVLNSITQNKLLPLDDKMYRI